MSNHYADVQAVINEAEQADVLNRLLDQVAQLGIRVTRLSVFNQLSLSNPSRNRRSAADKMLASFEAEGAVRETVSFFNQPTPIQDLSQWRQVVNQLELRQVA